MSNRIVGMAHRASRTMIMLVVIGVIALDPGVSQAKVADEQDQIILLNDSAAALEDTDPVLSKSLTTFADEKEKEWEAKNANKAQLPTPITDKYKAQVQDKIRILKAAALAIQPTYPLIAKSLNSMAKDLNKTIEIQK
jgi:hypothetical protein